MELVAQKREIFGKKVKSLRAKGLVPAELYGKALENLHLAVALKDFKKIFKVAGENAIVGVVIESVDSTSSPQEKRPALISGVTHDSLTDEVLSVDFYQVKMDELLRTKVPVDFIGESPAVKEGGVLVKAVQEVEIEALPGNIPQSFVVDLSRLAAIGQSFHVSDWPLADFSNKGVKILLAPDLVVATVKAQVTEEQEQTATVTTPTVESVKVESEEKKIEREQKKMGGEEKS